MFPVSELLDGRSTASWWLIIVCPRRTPRSHRGHQTNGGVISLIWQPGHLIKYFLGSDYRSHPPLRGRLVVWLYTERSVWWSDFTYGGQDGGLAREVRMEVWLHIERSDGGLTSHIEVRMEVWLYIERSGWRSELRSQIWLPIERSALSSGHPLEEMFVMESFPTKRKYLRCSWCHCVDVQNEL